MNRFGLARRASFALVLSSTVFVLTAVGQENEAAVQDAVVDVEVVEIEEEALDIQMAVLVEDNDTLKMRASVRVERALLRRACALSPDQEKALQQLNDQWVDKIVGRADKQANVAAQPGLIMRFFGVVAAETPRANPQETLKRAFTKEIEELLSDGQKLRYETQKASQDAFRAEAAAAAIVETFYERLALSDQQAEDIQQSIGAWAASTNLHMLPYFSNPQYYPDVPEHLMKPHLSVQQLKVFRGLTRHLFTDENFNDGQAPIVIEQ